MKWFKKHKILTVILAIFVLVPTIVAISNPGKDTTQPNQTQVVDQTKAEDEQLKQIAASQLTGKNNMDKDLLRKVEVTKQINGGWGVSVEYNASDNVTTNLRKSGIEIKMSEIYTALYKSGKDVRQASVAAYFPLTSVNGEDTEGVIYKSVLMKSKADTINFDDDRNVLQTKTIPAAWETTLLNKDFR